MNDGERLSLLGNSKAREPSPLLEKFKRPVNIERVTMTSDEVCANCPVTGQPDWYTVEIEYVPAEWCIESKSLKLKLQSYIGEGLFGETLASDLAQHVKDSIDPGYVKVTVVQKARGGVSIKSEAVLS